MPDKGIMGALTGAWDDFSEGVSQKATDLKEGTRDFFKEAGHKWDVGVGNKADLEKYQGHKEAQFNEKYRVGAHALYNKLLKDGVKAEDIDVGAFSPADIIAADKEVKGDARKAHATDEAFGKAVSAFETGEEAALAEKERKKTAENAQGILSNAMKAIATDKKEFLPPPAGTKGSVKADLGGMAGMLASRGNQLATQPLRLTSA